MNNAEWMIKNGMKFTCLVWGHSNGRNIVYYDPLKHVIGLPEPPESAKEMYSEKSTDVENLITKWLDMEHIEPILDDAERAYLSAVIKPFRERVWYIRKAIADDTSVYKCSYYIFIRFNDGTESMKFPVFHESEMYKGMSTARTYTPKELGL